MTEGKNKWDDVYVDGRLTYSGDVILYNIIKRREKQFT